MEPEGVQQELNTGFMNVSSTYIISNVEWLVSFNRLIVIICIQTDANVSVEMQ